MILQAVLDAWNNPYARALLMMSSAPKATPYDQSVAKFLVQKLDLLPGRLPCRCQQNQHVDLNGAYKDWSGLGNANIVDSIGLHNAPHHHYIKACVCDIEGNVNHLCRGSCP